VDDAAVGVDPATQLREACRVPPSDRSGTTPVELKERLAVERRGVPFVLYHDDGAQRIVELAREPQRLTIGRHPQCAISVQGDEEVSRVHAELELIHDEWTIVDDGLSRNGSFVNGKRIHGRLRLRSGDIIQVGHTLLRFCQPEPGKGKPTVAQIERVTPEISNAQRRVLVALCRPLAEGLLAVPASNREIAEELVVSVETVRTHLRALFEIFRIDDLPQNRKRAELARQALHIAAVSEHELRS
jgi:pSer/pThr/pTyr-binding forkhead associated (FHA) protein